MRICANYALCVYVRCQYNVRGGHYPMTAVLEQSPNVGYQITKGGNIRGYNIGRKDKSGRMSEQYSNPDNVAQTLTIQHHRIYQMEQKFRIRKLTPRECYRLMDVSEENIDKLLATDISMTQHYKMAGNSIVVSCLYHIFKNIYGDTQPTKMTQLKLF